MSTTEEKLQEAHRTAARALGLLSLDITRRSLSARRTVGYVSALRRAADLLEQVVTPKKEKT